VKQVYHPKASSALGAAYIAGMGIGLFSDLETIRSVWLQGSEETLPSQKNHSIYDSYFEDYLFLYEAFTAMMDKRAGVTHERR
jgi:sugar (pentulose or hexulose) kinase